MNSYIESIANTAVNSLLLEAYLSPKPGLVDALDAGSHKDMDISTFKASSLSLQNSFQDYILIGFHHTGSPHELLSKIRRRGVDAEKEMFTATNGINTHKGANFSFALFLSAIGVLLQTRDRITSDDFDDLRLYIKEVAKDLVKNDFKGIESKDRAKLSNGEKLYVDYNYAGIRQEAQDAYPNIFEIGLPQLFSSKSQDASLRYSSCLIHLIAYVDDGNVIHRAGFEGLSYTQDYARHIIIDLNDSNYVGRINEMNDALKLKNISPGGCADLLALLIFLDLLDSSNNRKLEIIQSIISPRDYDLGQQLQKTI